MESYHHQNIEQLTTRLNSDLSTGLTTSQASEKLAQFGPNLIDLSNKFNFFKAFWEQLSNPIVMLLIGVVIIAAFTGEIIEAGLIVVIIMVMSGIGVYLEAKAGNAVEELKRLASTHTQVMRDGRLFNIDSRELVPGDVVYLQEGDKVPADLLLASSNELQVNEAVLTGESVPVHKVPGALDIDTTLADRRNCLFAGTLLVQGKCIALVVNTALNTELGAIASQLAEQESKATPLQIQLENLSKLILIGTLAFCSVVLLLQLLRGYDLVHSLIETLSLAVAFIPEGLSAVMTITLALGVREMVKKDVIIKRLLAAEGLGSVSVLATDKTGTITTGDMSVSKLWVLDQEIEADKFKATSPVEQKLVDIIKYCNSFKGATEIALVNFLNRLGIEFELESREVEHRFSSSLKRMMTILRRDKELHGYAKGAPDVLIELCHQYFDTQTDEVKNLDAGSKERILAAATKYASQGYRVIALAYREFPNSYQAGERDKDEFNLSFIGLACLIDPLRSEVPSTVLLLKRAGIRPVMITGDHPEIARTIAKQANILDDNYSDVITGVQLEQYFTNGTGLTDDQIANCLVFARVTPEHKQKLIQIYRNKGFVTAMAGDGINDAIAIAQSDIGIAVANATDIVKEAADVIVTGSYNALANAVEVGRVIIFRTRLYLHYLLSGNACQVGTFTLCLLFNYPAPMTALSLLLINILTDAAPAISMAVEKSSSTLMNDKPRASKEGIINTYIWRSIAIQGLVSSIFLFLVFSLSYPFGLVYAQTATFTAYLAQKLMRGFTARSLKQSVFSYGFFSNKFMLVAILFAVVVWFGSVYLLPHIFNMQPMQSLNVIAIILAAMLMPIIEEAQKFFYRRSLHST